MLPVLPVLVPPITFEAWSCLWSLGVGGVARNVWNRCFMSSGLRNQEVMETQVLFGEEVFLLFFFFIKIMFLKENKELLWASNKRERKDMKSLKILQRLEGCEDGAGERERVEQRGSENLPQMEEGESWEIRGQLRRNDGVNRPASSSGLWGQAVEPSTLHSAWDQEWELFGGSRQATWSGFLYHCRLHSRIYLPFKKWGGNFHGGSVEENLISIHGDTGSIPGLA